MFELLNNVVLFCTIVHAAPLIPLVNQPLLGTGEAASKSLIEFAVLIF